MQRSFLFFIQHFKEHYLVGQLMWNRKLPLSSLTSPSENTETNQEYATMYFHEVRVADGK